MSFNTVKQFVQAVWRERERAQVPLLSAGLAYYAVSAIAPLLLIIIGVSGLVLDADAVQQTLLTQLSQVVGQNTADIIAGAINQSGIAASGRITTVVGGVVLVISATGFFFQLRNALNLIWRVDRQQYTGTLNMLQSYLFGLAVVLLLGFLLIASFAASTVFNLLDSVTDALPFLSDTGLRGFLSLVVSVIVVTLILTIIYQVLPDVKVRWRDVIWGALMAGVLLYLVRLLFSTFIARVTTLSPFSGAAGALSILLLWLYVSSQVVLLGAVITQVYAKQYGSQASPPGRT